MLRLRVLEGFLRRGGVGPLKDDFHILLGVTRAGFGMLAGLLW
jgi:hypothetical protein